MFCKSNVNKTVYFFILLKYRKIITVKTVTLHKKLYFFIFFFFKKKKTGTNFILLSQLKNMVEQLKKAYLHRPIKILHFFRTRENSKVFSITSKYFSFRNNFLKPPASRVAHITRDFFRHYSFSYYSSMQHRSACFLIITK